MPAGHGDRADKAQRTQIGTSKARHVVLELRVGGEDDEIGDPRDRGDRLAAGLEAERVGAKRDGAEQPADRHGIGVRVDETDEIPDDDVPPVAEQLSQFRIRGAAGVRTERRCERRCDRPPGGHEDLGADDSPGSCAEQRERDSRAELEQGRDDADHGGSSEEELALDERRRHDRERAQQKDRAEPANEACQLRLVEEPRAERRQDDARQCQDEARERRVQPGGVNGLLNPGLALDQRRVQTRVLEQLEYSHGKQRERCDAEFPPVEDPGEGERSQPGGGHADDGRGRDPAGADGNAGA